MNALTPKSAGRIDLIDALRGSALLGILLLHSIEHFDFLRYPATAPEWLRALDIQTRDTLFFLFGGKAYAIFALMFGLSFFLILDRAAQRGVEFRGRFLWRLGVLAIIGYAHGLLYCGDILGMLAVLGVPLVLFHRLGTRALLWISAVLLLQLPLVWDVVNRWLETGHPLPRWSYGRYYGEIYQVFGQGDLGDVIRANAVKGQLAKWGWSIDNGRYLQMIGLFAWGLVLGRHRIFEHAAPATRLAWRAVIVGVIAFPPLWYVEAHLAQWLPRGPLLRAARQLTDSYGDLAQMLIWAGGFVLLYHRTRLRTALHLLAPYGRMSLTCYVTQALVWVPVYYHFGLGLFRHWGQFYSLLAGVAFFAVQLTAAHVWLRYFEYGPLEWVWRSATLLSLATPFRKRQPPAAARTAASVT